MDSPHQTKQKSIKDGFSTIELSKKSSFSKIHPKPKPIFINKGSHKNSIQTGIDPRKSLSVLHSNDSKRRSINFRKYTSEEVNRLSNEKKKIDTIYAVLSCVGLAFAWIENDIFYNNKNKSNLACHTMRFIVSTLCMISHLFIYRHYKLEIEIQKSRKILYLKTTLYNSSYIKSFIYESIFNWIHCPPFLDSVIKNEQIGVHFDISIDAYISVIMIGRLYVFLRLFEHYTFWTGPRAIRVCKINGFLPDSKFAIKAYLKYKSALVLVLSLGLSIFLFGFALRTFERPFVSPVLAKRFNFDYLLNCFWCVIVTMTTIGYGDIYPQTHLGRLVIVIACIWGIFILSLFVVTLNNTSQLTKEEAKAYEELVRDDNKIKEYLQNEGAKLITALFKLNLARKKKLKFKDKILKKMDLIGTANRHATIRKNLTKQIKGTNEILNEMHVDVGRELQELTNSVQPFKKGPSHVESLLEYQGEIDDMVVEFHENSRKLISLLKGLNQDQMKHLKELSDFNLNQNMKETCSSHLKNTSLPFKLLPVNNDLFDSPPYQPEDDLKSLEMELNKDKYRRLVSSIPKGNNDLNSANNMNNQFLRRKYPAKSCECKNNFYCPTCNIDYETNYNEMVMNCPCGATEIICPACNIAKAMRQIHEAAEKEAKNFENTDSTLEKQSELQAQLFNQAKKYSNQLMKIEAKARQTSIFLQKLSNQASSIREKMLKTRKQAKLLMMKNIKNVDNAGKEQDPNLPEIIIKQKGEKKYDIEILNNEKGFDDINIDTTLKKEKKKDDFLNGENDKFKTSDDWN